MRIKLLAIVAVAALALGPVHAGPPDDEQQEATPCEAKAISIAERATRFTERANNTTIPFDIADNAAKSCGVLVRGIQELRDMGCPAEIVQLAVDAQKESKETLDSINDHYDFRFNCFVPEFLY